VAQSVAQHPACSSRPGPVPVALGLDPFYEKYLDGNDIPVVSSSKVTLEPVADRTGLASDSYS
jgi:hypothetical protein